MKGGSERAAAMWARTELRRRWRAVILLGLLVGVTAGVAFSALAGARRTSTAELRLRQRTLAADAIVFPSQVNDTQPDWGPISQRPEIARLAVWDLAFGTISGPPGSALFASDNGTYSVLFASDNGAYLGTVDKPVVVKGRMFNPTAPDEVVVDESAQQYAPLGSRVRFQAYAPDQPDTTGQPRGPTVIFHVVGVVRELPEFLFVSHNFGGQVFLSPGYVARYRSNVFLAENGSIRLHRGAADMPALRRDVNALVHPGTPVLDLHADSRPIDTTLGVERVALLVLAVAVALGGGILVAQVLSRSAASVTDDAGALRALGMTGPELGMASAMSHLPAAGVGAVGSFAVALGLSSRFPVGLGRLIDPDVGTHVDWTVLGPGAALVLAAVLVGPFVIGLRAAQAERAGRNRSSAMLQALRRRAPVSVGLGTTMAFEAGRGRTRVPVLPALLASVVAVLGVVATLTIDHGIADALHHPEWAGVNWDVTVTPSPDALTTHNVSISLANPLRRALEPGSTTAVIDRVVSNVGGVGAPVFTVRPLAGAGTSSIGLTVITGRPPTRRGEVALGPATATDIHARVGDVVRIGNPPVALSVVGEALFPSDVHSEFDEGAWLAPEQFDAAVPPPSPANPATSRVVAIRFSPGTDVARATTALTHRLASAGGGASPIQSIDPASLPDELVNLQNVRFLPDVLAGFLGLLAVAALAFVLSSSTRRRRRDFAVLRALGMERRTCRLVVNTHGTAIGLVGILLGIPLGLAVGRSGWRLITERVPLSDVNPLAVVAVVLTVPATLVLANLLGLWPGRRVTRPRLAAQELRAE